MADCSFPVRILERHVNARILGVLFATLLAGCSLLRPPPPPDRTAIEHAERLKSEAVTQLDLDIKSLYECMFRYADNHAHAAATPTEIAEAATVACDDDRGELTNAIKTHEYAEARAAWLTRGARMPSPDDLTTLADRLAEETVEDGRKRALEIIVRARSPIP